MPLTPDELHEFITHLDELSREIATHRALLAVTDRRSRWAKKVAAIGVIIGVLGIMVGAGAVSVGASARATAHDNAAIRKEQQVAACIQANLNTQRTREALIAGVSVLTQPDPRRTPNEQAGVDRFVVEYTGHVNGALPFRDCSAKGILSYYANPPADPALGAGVTTTTLPPVPTTTPTKRG